MKPEEQRIAIAKACGWTKFTPDTIQYTARRSDGKWGLIPDYLSDLNAMHEAEKVLTDLNLYRKFLYLVVLEDPSNASNEPAWATAAQRAEAFLRTLNLWIE
jgi:hypothetical protein